MAISVSRFITNVFFYDVFNVKKQKSFVQSLTRQKLKNKLEKNALFHPLSCIGAILVKQMSVYTHHKKLHYQSFTHKEKNSVKFEAERFL